VNEVELASDAVLQENSLLRFADQVYGHYNKKIKNPFPKDVRRKASKALLNVIMDIVGLRSEEAHANLMLQFARGSVPWSVVMPSAKATIAGIREIVFSLPVVETRDRPDETRDRATLYYANHLAMCGEFEAAQDLLIFSQLRDRVSRLTFRTAIIYNRVCAQIGLAAFEGGSYATANQTLTHLFDHKASERFALFMLGQAPSDPDDRRRLRMTAEELTAREVDLRSVCLAPHLHISLAKVELAAYCSTLLDECVPEARRPFDRPRTSEHFHRVISKTPHVWGLEQAIQLTYNALRKGDSREAIRVLFDL
jgi:hypothetical protein